MGLLVFYFFVMGKMRIKSSPCVPIPSFFFRKIRDRRLNLGAADFLSFFFLGRPYRSSWTLLFPRASTTRETSVHSFLFLSFLSRSREVAQRVGRPSPFFLLLSCDRDEGWRIGFLFRATKRTDRLPVRVASFYGD